MENFLKEILLNLVTKVGLWIEKHFPEKITADDVMARLKKFDAEMDALHQGIEAFEMRISNIPTIASDVEKLKADVQKLQAALVIKSKIPSYGGNMNPSNFSLPPVIPASASK